MRAGRHDAEQTEVWAQSQAERAVTGASEEARLRRANEHLHARVREAEAGWRLFAHLYDAAPVGYLLLDDRAHILEVNQAALRMLSSNRVAIMGTSLSALVEPTDVPAFALHLQRVFASEGMCTSHLSFKGDDAPFLAYLQSVAETTPRGHRTCRMVLSSASERFREEHAHSERVAQDRALSEEIDAERRRTERVTAVGALIAESLDVAETAARAVRVAVPELATFCAIDLLDADGHVVRAASASVARANGDPRQDPPLDPYAPRGSALVVRTERAEVLPRLAPADILALVADAGSVEALRRLVRSYVCVPLRAHGRTIGAVTFARSGNEPFTTEDVARADELARHIAIVLDNALLYQAAKDADLHKDEFLAMLGHELRNPLAAISVAIAVLRLGDASPSTRKAADVVGRQSARLTRLVDDLLDVSRVTRGKISLQLERVALDEVVSRAVESVRPLIEARRHTLSIALPEPPVILEADATRLEQVLVNLVGNAARYTNPGGRIAIEASRRGSELTVCVRDNGIGMTREDLARIFEPFTRIAPSLDHGDRGLGIGLTLARILVELHGGKLIAHSAGLGRGSEVGMYLPASVAAEERPPAAPIPAPARPETVRRRLLLVEDEPDLAELTSERLLALGSEVRVARDGIEAVSAAIAFRPDVLIVDLGLPGMSGFDVVQRLRGEEALSGALFVALTGYGDAAARRRSLEAGFDRHLTKPITDDALLQLLGAA